MSDSLRVLIPGLSTNTMTYRQWYTVDSVRESRKKSIRLIKKKSIDLKLFARDVIHSMQQKIMTSRFIVSSSQIDAPSDGARCKIYVDMCADLFHAGHINFIRQVREKSEKLAKDGESVWLVVGLCSDKDIESYKRKPVLDIEERQVAVSSCRYVDEVIPNCPLKMTEDFIKENNINYVFHGDDFTPEALNCYYKVPIEMGIMETVPYTDGISTSEIIGRIQSMKKDKAKEPEVLVLDS